MSDAVLKLEREDQIAILTLNRPEALNALNLELRRAIVDAFAALAQDEDVRAVVLIGEGRAFSVGVDLKEAGKIGFALGADGGDLDIVRAMAAYPWPIICAINGFAITGGFELALGGDILLASEDARFADTHARVGVMPGWGLSQKLSRMIGASRAKELSFTGNFLDAAMAERWGLVNHVFPAGALRDEAVKMAKTITECDPRTLRGYKSIIDDGFAMSFGDGMAEEARRSEAFAQEHVSAEGVEAARKNVTARGRSVNAD